jgi:hypothetical protein
MLYDDINVQDVVDSEAALEFMKEATKLATSKDLKDIGLQLEKKSQQFSNILSEDNISNLTENEFRQLVGSIFSIKRKANRIIKANGFESLYASISELLYGDGSLEKRFNTFTESIEQLDGPMRVNFASELLHFSNPKNTGYGRTGFGIRNKNRRIAAGGAGRRRLNRSIPWGNLCKGRPIHGIGQCSGSQYWFSGSGKVSSAQMFFLPAFMQSTCTLCSV